MDEILRRMGQLDIRVDNLTAEVAKLTGSSQNMELLLKWVVLPLIIIMGGLVGVRVLSP